MKTNRLLSVDILRGLTIIFMIIVNDPGSWSHVYAPLLHAEWNGITPTDYIFPTFLFIVGVSIVLSLSNKKSQNISKTILLKKIVDNKKPSFAESDIVHRNTQNPHDFQGPAGCRGR